MKYDSQYILHAVELPIKKTLQSDLTSGFQQDFPEEEVENYVRTVRHVASEQDIGDEAKWIKEVTDLKQLD